MGYAGKNLEERMLLKIRLLLTTNVGLFLYTVMLCVQKLKTYPNFFTDFFNNFASNTTDLTARWHFSFLSWRSLVFLVILVALLFLLLKFWRVTFVLLEVIAGFLLLDYFLLLFQKQIDLSAFYPFIVLIIALMNIWHNSKVLKLL